MRAQYLCTTSQAKKVTLLVWVMSALLAVPTGFVRVRVKNKNKIFYKKLMVFSGEPTSR
jgi:hypothetical protein